MLFFDRMMKETHDTARKHSATMYLHKDFRGYFVSEHSWPDWLFKANPDGTGELSDLGKQIRGARWCSICGKTLRGGIDTFGSHTTPMCQECDSELQQG
jgi:hypothetical protein